MLEYCIHTKEFLDEEMEWIAEDPHFQAFWLGLYGGRHDKASFRETLKAFSETEHWERFCEDFRKNYCGISCVDRHDCTTGLKYMRLPEKQDPSGETFLSETH